ncbi:hypothetical protein NOR_05976 [Metarhizium rileyi]|uniref:Uncharacterized protein n=1 Tax=Metarhizium rileyi (strain RCEF 4871) TaxID=1649241 RepID=A0A167BFF0_METRR|nr:hypothetical protein NOR_05976 [Metarhizium rileyi RCEF 4871]
MRTVSFLICLAAVAVAAPAPIRDQLAAPRVNQRDEAPRAEERAVQALYDNGNVPPPW